MTLHQVIEDAAVARGALCPDMCGAPYTLVHDTALMPDGRPLFAWVFEIDSLRKEVADLKAGEREDRLRTWQKVLQVAEWVVKQRPDDLMGAHVHIRFDRRKALDEPLESALEIVAVSGAATDGGREA